MPDLQPEGKVKRVPVDYRHDAINPEFIHCLARIAGYAAQKYGSPMQYLDARLMGEKGPINHARNHIGEYQLGKLHDHFGDLRFQLAAAAYNLMMEFNYISRGEEPDLFPPKDR